MVYFRATKSFEQAQSAWQHKARDFWYLTSCQVRMLTKVACMVSDSSS